MRYILRNKDKIAKAYSEEILKRIIKSLDAYFANKNINIDNDINQINGDIYKTLIIEDLEHSVNLISFYIINKTFDVYKLAFKEFIG